MWTDCLPLVLFSSITKLGVLLHGQVSSSWLGVVPRGKLTGRELVTELEGRELAQFYKRKKREWFGLEV